MTGKVLEDVLKKHFKGKYELQVDRAEAIIRGDSQENKEINPNLGTQVEAPDILIKNIQ